MFVQRNLFKMKPEHWDELKGQLKKWLEQLEEGAPNIRVYADYVGPPKDTFVVEYEWESLADFESTWDKWLATGPKREFADAWAQCVDHGISTEIWRLIEL